MTKKIQILCTLGPSSLNRKFLNFTNNKVSLLRLNMSHIKLKKLKHLINFIKKNTSTPICIDTEGAQIRTKINKKKKFKINQIFKIHKLNGKIMLYPPDVFNKLKINDALDIGYNDLMAKIISKNKKYLSLKTTSSGTLESNKGVHIKNRLIKLNYLTKKDFEAIKVAKKFKIKNFALSFTNTVEDINKFNKILPKENKIFKIESKQAVKNIGKFFKLANNFLIDRGDLSKSIKIENIPIAQRKIIKISKKHRHKNVFIATNFLETMIEDQTPTRAEANDIYNALEIGAKGLVLAAETAIGKFPDKAVIFLNKIIKIYKNEKKI